VYAIANEALELPEDSPGLKAFFESLSLVVQASDIATIWESRPELVSVLLRLRPHLTYESAAWNCEGECQRVEFESLLGLEEVEWQSVLEAALTAGNNVVADELVAKVGTNSFGVLARSVTNLSTVEIASAWREAFAHLTPEFLTLDLKHSAAELALFAWLSPTDVLSCRLDLEECLRSLASVSQADLPPILRICRDFLLVSLMLRSSSGDDALADEGILRVYDALATNRYPRQLWSLLSPSLPDLGWFRDWDKCERLRRGIRRHWSDRGISGNPLRCLLTSSTLGNLVEKFDGGIMDVFVD
jgi:hypothetical protein